MSRRCIVPVVVSVVVVVAGVKAGDHDLLARARGGGVGADGGALWPGGGSLDDAGPGDSVPAFGVSRTCCSATSLVRFGSTEGV